MSFVVRITRPVLVCTCTRDFTSHTSKVVLRSLPTAVVWATTWQCTLMRNLSSVTNVDPASAATQLCGRLCTPRRRTWCLSVNTVERDLIKGWIKSTMTILRFILRRGAISVPFLAISTTTERCWGSTSQRSTWTSCPECHSCEDRPRDCATTYPISKFSQLPILIRQFSGPERSIVHSCQSKAWCPLRKGPIEVPLVFWGPIQNKKTMKLTTNDKKNIFAEKLMGLKRYQLSWWNICGRMVRKWKANKDHCIFTFNFYHLDGWQHCTMERCLTRPLSVK